MRSIAAVAVLAALTSLGCGKTTSSAPAPALEVGPRPPLEPRVGVLPTTGLASSVDEDTAFDIAEMTGDDPAAPRCTDVKLELNVVKDRAGLQQFQATLINQGKRAVALVDPGDGSESGWRTPVITWKVTTLQGRPVQREDGARCGNMNELEEREIFRLKPGARHVLGPWLGAPHGAEGRFLVRLVYENDPGRKIAGLLREGTSPVLERVKRTTPCKVESNAVAAVLDGR